MVRMVACLPELQTQVGTDDSSMQCARCSGFTRRRRAPSGAERHLHHAEHGMAKWHAPFAAASLADNSLPIFAELQEWHSGLRAHLRQCGMPTVDVDCPEAIRPLRADRAGSTAP